MFNTISEAQELNSDCAFCHKPKFAVMVLKSGPFVESVSLERCKDEKCDKHCEWNHSSDYIYQVQTPHEDVMDIIRGH